MPGIKLAAVGAATLAAFVFSTVWYIVFAKPRRELSDAAAVATRRPPPLKIAGELIRNIFLAYVLAYVLAETGVTAVGGTMRLGLILWIGFPVVLLQPFPSILSGFESSARAGAHSDSRSSLVRPRLDA
jgi:Protein of unknown function (DUF1761)